MKCKSYFSLLLFSIVASTGYAQTPFTTTEYIDINNIKASVLLHGDLWYDAKTELPACEYPKGSGKHVNFAGALWMAGMDDKNKLHVAAQTYRQGGVDFWPGPLSSKADIEYAESSKWAKIWKVKKETIDAFKALSDHTEANTDPSILEWPAKGNTFAKGNKKAKLDITTDIAPFIDVDADNIYNPLKGDYPNIKGDMALWWIINDNGPDHASSYGEPLKVEIAAMAYAFKRGTLIDNVIFYQYQLTNRSKTDYTNYRLGMWVDSDLGLPSDDFIGFDSARRMGYTYNGDDMDSTGDGNSYGSVPPISGLTYLEMPGETGVNQGPIGCFSYFNNSSDSLVGNPAEDVHFDNLLRAKLLDGTHFRNDFTGYGNQSTGTGSGPETNFVFSGDPADSTAWSECSSQNTPNDRRVVFGSTDYTFKAGSTIQAVFAMVVTDTSANNVCGKMNLAAIRAVTDTAWNAYKSLSVPKNIPANAKLKLYPNPTSDKLYLEVPTNDKNTLIKVYDVFGRYISLETVINNNKVEINTSILPAGVYNILYQTENLQGTAKFTKQ